MRGALFLMLLDSSRAARFNVVTQVTSGCRIDVEVAKVRCANTEVEPRTMVAGGYFWILF